PKMTRTVRARTVTGCSRNGVSSVSVRRYWPISACGSCAYSARHASWSDCRGSVWKRWSTSKNRESEKGNSVQGRSAVTLPPLALSTFRFRMSRQRATDSTHLRSPPSARYAVVASRWNEDVVDTLLEGARRAFTRHGIPDERVSVVRVPGAWEIPVLAAQLARTG